MARRKHSELFLSVEEKLSYVMLLIDMKESGRSPNEHEIKFALNCLDFVKYEIEKKLPEVSNG